MVAENPNGVRVALPVRSTYLRTLQRLTDVLSHQSLPAMLEMILSPVPVITKAIGQLQPLAVEVQEIPFAPGESLILATDGMYHVSTFEGRTLSAVRSFSLADGISQLVRHSADNFADDATIAILRRNDVSDRIKYIDVLEKGEDYRQHDLFGHIVGATLLEQCSDCLTKGDWTGAVTRMEYAEKFDIRLSRNNLIALLDIATANTGTLFSASRNVCDKLRQMIRRAS